MSRLTHRNTYLGEGNNGGKGTSNDNDYYYCSGDVGKVVNQPHAESFPLVCLAPPIICQSTEHVFFDDSLPYTNTVCCP